MSIFSRSASSNNEHMTHILENGFIDQANVDMVSSYYATSNGSNERNCTKRVVQSIFEPGREKTGFLHMRKQRRRSAPLFSLHG